MLSKKSCFVISPIGEDGSAERRRADNVFKYVIKPAVSDYEVVRADQIADPGIISEQIVGRIQNDDLVIADLTGGNPNVFYELAVRHAVGKPTIQIIEKGERIPFDVVGMRTIAVNHQDLESVDECKKAIAAAIEATEREDYRVISPLSGPLNLAQLQEGNSINDVATVLVGMLDVLRSHSTQLDKITRDLTLPPRSIFNVRPDPSFVAFMDNPAFSLTGQVNFWTCVCGKMNTDQYCSGCGTANPTSTNP